jgi:hypothetical protein
MECIINDKRIKYEDGEIYSYIKWGLSKEFKWYILNGTVNGKYRRLKINHKAYHYHRVIFKLHNHEWNIDDCSKSNQIDHKDRKTLNNNIENLRCVTQQQNNFNKTGKGYTWDKQKQKYKANISKNGKRKHLGYFDNEIDARNCYLEAKKIYHVIE